MTTSPPDVITTNLRLAGSADPADADGIVACFTEDARVIDKDESRGGVFSRLVGNFAGESPTSPTASPCETAPSPSSKSALPEEQTDFSSRPWGTSPAEQRKAGILKRVPVIPRSSLYQRSTSRNHCQCAR